MILKQYEGVFIVLNKFLGGFFKRTLDPFTYPDMPMQFLVKEDKFQFTEDYVTPEITIPKGFITDGASTPRWLKGLYPGYYKYFPAAAVHDYLYGQGAVSRKDCDALLRDIIRTRLNMSWRYWFVMWVAVRAGGTSHYTKRIIEGNTVAPVQ